MRGRGVIDVVVRHRADQRQLPGALGQAREVLADAQSWYGCGNRRELAAVLGRRVGLHVPGVLVRRAAPHEQEDAGLGAAARRRWILTGLNEAWQPHAEETERA